jgi:GNAT superfamily N-acetyltransferase
MPAMVDPTSALVSFQEAFRRDTINPERGRVDRKLLVLLDEPRPGVHRFTYARVQGKTVMALCSFSPADFHERLPVFQAGVAVPEQYRGQGRGKEIMAAAIAELKNGFFNAGIKQFWIEAIVAKDNHASNALAMATITKDRAEIVDKDSGTPAYHYMVKAEQPAA